nr:MAG TPA: hypothetical protein [Caudoviricetes sp.]
MVTEWSRILVHHTMTIPSHQTSYFSYFLRFLTAESPATAPLTIAQEFVI